MDNIRITIIQIGVPANEAVQQITVNSGVTVRDVVSDLPGFTNGVAVAYKGQTLTPQAMAETVLEDGNSVTLTRANVANG